MVGTELLKGQGLGNQLFCYVTTRCIAMKQGRDFSILGSETLANNIHSSCGLYFMDLDFGVKAEKKILQAPIMREMTGYLPAVPAMI